MIETMYDLNARVVYFPVRHHSPACARRVRELALRMKPAAVLIEGPSDFNERMDELYLPHRLPIAVYSYVRLPGSEQGGLRLGAYYPFCIYSPEWQTLLAAREVGARARFIDLPWHDVARVDDVANRYADRGLRGGKYIKRLCQQAGVENFDDLWDTYFELDDVGLEEFLRRCHHFCLHTRLLDDEIRLSDRRREAFMAEQVRKALAEFEGQLLVVTGGYHSSAIHARLTGQPLAGTDDPTSYELQPLGEGAEAGCALTPYSYEQLDSLRDYNAGMPNPGFYHQVWEDGSETKDSHRRLFRRVIRVLRDRKQQVSTADLIAAETMARGLAQLRGHSRVWRRDLVDGIIGALIKEERSYGMGHPLLDAVHEVFRGGERGLLAEGTRLPPLVHDLRELLRKHDLEAKQTPREIDVDLHVDSERSRSRILHRLRILEISGYDCIGGTDMAVRDDLSKVWERWRIHWTPDFDAKTIEAARYGPSLADAAAARLDERARSEQRNAEAAAQLLLQASLAGLSALANTFLQQLADLIRGDSDFVSVTRALGHLLYLYRFDEVLQTSGREDLGALFVETYTRCLWLFEGLGQVSGRDQELISGVETLLFSYDRCAEPLGLDREEFVAVFARVSIAKHQSPALRGAATGALWTVGESNAEQVAAQLLLFADPDHLGDFLSGLFALARETVQRHRDLVLSIDRLLVAFADEEFLTALPSLRLAFTYFTPREKHHLALTLLEALGVKSDQSMTKLDVSPEEAARAIAFESRLFEAMTRYGLRRWQA